MSGNQQFVYFSIITSPCYHFPAKLSGKIYVNEIHELYVKNKRDSHEPIRNGNYR